MQQNQLEKKIHDATTFLGSQTDVASSLHSTIREDLKSAEQTARMQLKGIKRLQKGLSDAAFSEKQLLARIATEAP